jgi:hypothetical protein
MSNVVPLRRYRDGGLPEAYQIAHMDKPCPNCGAGAGDYCNHGGYTRIIPCVARMHNNNGNGHDHVDEAPLPKPQPLRQVHDFSEPRRQQQ